MLFKSAIIAAATVLFAGQAIASAMPEPEMLEKRVATDPWSACQAPRNSDHREGSSCKYHSGVSDQSPVVSGTCHSTTNQGLICQA